MKIEGMGIQRGSDVEAAKEIIIHWTRTIRWGGWEKRKFLESLPKWKEVWVERQHLQIDFFLIYLLITLP